MKSTIAGWFALSQLVVSIGAQADGVADANLGGPVHPPDVRDTGLHEERRQSPRAALQEQKTDDCQFGPVALRIDPHALDEILFSSTTRREAWERILMLPDDPGKRPIAFVISAPDDGLGAGLRCGTVRTDRDLRCNFPPIRKRIDYRDVEDIIETSETRREAYERVQAESADPDAAEVVFVIRSEDDGGKDLVCKPPPRVRSRN